MTTTRSSTSTQDDHSDLIQRARAWINADPDQVTREEATRLLNHAIERGDYQALSDRFAGRLHFGTAGLRGEVGAGPQRMSRVLIYQVSMGLARYLNAQVTSEPAARPLVVIGYDGRHMSDVFARDAARVLAAMGFEVQLASELCPTPILAYAVRHLGAVAGIMVTASHNPPRDNGFKVYWSNGAQIIPPQDIEISAAIDEVTLDEVAEFTRGESDLSAVQDLWSVVDVGFDGEVGQAYWRAQKAHLPEVSDVPQRPLRVVYTAMHGVGAKWFTALMQQRPHLELIPVPEQCDPDPDFPTVSFPNPEEPGALDFATALANRAEADIILAHDPDADRLAVVARDASGELKPFTGDQVGALIAQELFTQLEVGPRDLVATTIVSSSLLSEMARAHDVQCAETLTGFKWIANRALAHEREGGRFLFGYEEAIGYSLHGIVRDKDGLSAGLLLAEMAWRSHHAGRTLWDELNAVYERYGLYVSSLESRVRQGREGAEEIRGWMKLLRERPPRTLGGVEVVETTDFMSEPSPLTGNVLRYRLADGSRVIVRPSGTEPKIKMYFEARVMSDDPIAARAETGAARLSELTASLFSILDTPTERT